MIVMGRMTMRKMGVAMLTTMMVLKTERMVMRKERIERGMVSSITLMSLENLLRIRPRGVVSKKDMGQRRMLSISFLWRVLEAR